MKKLLLISTIALAVISCTPKKWVITDASSGKIMIDATTEKDADEGMKEFIEPYKLLLDKEMNQVIGYSKQEMTKGKPESLLSNWNADVYLEVASEFLGSKVDMAVVNLGGLRAPIPQGDVTIRNIFQLMPFENELVILWLEGKQIKELLNIFAKEGGQGVSGVNMLINNGRAEDCKIGGVAIDDEKLYSIATNDYLAGGNDRMKPFTVAKKRVDTKLKLRNVVMEYVIRQTREGKQLQTQLDGRIKLKQTK